MKPDGYYWALLTRDDEAPVVGYLTEDKLYIIGTMRPRRLSYVYWIADEPLRPPDVPR